MAVRTIMTFEEQSGIGAGESDAFIVNPTKEVSTVSKLTAGTPSTGARVYVTLDEVEKIQAGTATWVASPLGNRTGTSAEKLFRPVTGAKLVVTDGTWSFQVRQN